MRRSSNIELAILMSILRHRRHGDDSVRIEHGKKVKIYTPSGYMLIVDIYPVGLLAEIQQSWRYKRKWIRPKPRFANLVTAILYLVKGDWKLAREEWRPFKSYFNGYFAEPDVFPGRLTRCGSGWTRGRAVRDLERRVWKNCP